MEQDIFHTVSGQRDPTAGAAISKLISDERKAQRLQEKKLKEITSCKKSGVVSRPRKNENGEWVLQTADTVEPYRGLANAVITVAYRDYVRILRLLESIPEPDPLASEKILMKHAKRIDRLKAEMEEIEEFFYSPLYALACDINPDTLINKAWEEAYE